MKGRRRCMFGVRCFGRPIALASTGFRSYMHTYRPLFEPKPLFGTEFPPRPVGLRAALASAAQQEHPYPASDGGAATTLAVLRLERNRSNRSGHVLAGAVLARLGLAVRCAATPPPSPPTGSSRPLQDL